MNKECAACGWDGSLTRMSCPGCGEEKWYCSDCHASGRAFNCSDCQAHSGVGEVEKNCMVCSRKIIMLHGPMSVDLVCGECNENFEGVFNGDHPTFYGTYSRELAEAAAHEYGVHDSQKLDFFNPAEFAVVKWADITCQCPREETRWNKEYQH